MSRRLKKLAVIAASMVIAATSNEGVLSSVKADAAWCRRQRKGCNGVP